jgi:hypothetical protein
MTKSDKENWIINIQNAANEVATLFGNDEVTHILKKYGASSIENLSPCYFTKVFDELDFRASELR